MAYKMYRDVPPPKYQQLESSRAFLRLFSHYDKMPLPGEDKIPEDGKHVEGRWGLAALH